MVDSSHCCTHMLSISVSGCWGPWRASRQPWITGWLEIPLDFQTEELVGFLTPLIIEELDTGMLLCSPPLLSSARIFLTGCRCGFMMSHPACPLSLKQQVLENHGNGAAYCSVPAGSTPAGKHRPFPALTGQSSVSLGSCHASRGPPMSGLGCVACHTDNE